jgi:hypothetical protein
VRRISPIVLGKLLLHPLLIFLLLHFLLPVPAWLQVAAVLFACAPMMSIYPIMGQKYGHEGLCAATLLAATVTSFFPSAACSGCKAEQSCPCAGGNKQSGFSWLGIREWLFNIHPMHMVMSCHDRPCFHSPCFERLPG